MKNVIIQTRALTQVTARFGLVALFAVLLFAGCLNITDPPENFTVQPVAKKSLSGVPSLGSAESFAVLSGPAVTLTDAIVYGDVGLGAPIPGSVITLTNSQVFGMVHDGDGVAIAAYSDFLSAYDAFAGRDVRRRSPDGHPCGRDAYAWCLLCQRGG